MVQEIMKDMIFLAQPSVPATPDDLPCAPDLLDTLKAHRESCVGMAGIMIGIRRRIIAFNDAGKYAVLFNPEIVKRSDPYETEEGCLSLAGVRSAKRYRKIQVRYQDDRFRTRYKTYEGWTAQIVQHEIDHCNGILI